MVRAAFVEKFRVAAGKRIAVVRARPTGAEAQRELHTLKGEAQLVGFAAVSKLAREMERLLERGADAQLLRALAVLEELVAMAPDDPEAMERAIASIGVDPAPRD